MPILESLQLSRGTFCILTFQFNEGELWHTRKHEALQLTGHVIQSCIKIEGEDPGTYVRFQPETKTLTGMEIKREELQFCKCISVQSFYVIVILFWRHIRCISFISLLAQFNLFLSYYFQRRCFNNVTDLFSFTFYKCIILLDKRPVVRYVCTITCQADDQIYDVVADLDNGEIMIQVFLHKKINVVYFSPLCKQMVLTPLEDKGVYYIHSPLFAHTVLTPCDVKYKISRKILDILCTIQIQQPISLKDPDNRFFIFYELDDGNNVYELFLYASMNLFKV